MSYNSTIPLHQVEFGTPVFRSIVMYSPVIQNIKVLQKAFIHGGKKRVKRSKLYYLLERHPSQYTVT
jgi:ribosomal protein L19